ncbi:DUF6479 family protein [Streptomyces sp. TLI_171]|uniref:DUF6479 family protein n=1 Tax=Streptomyces sp. TLI_171 TaxID=1938859 RepID=UPI000C175392|nr:DUF6479 family protein [Streptomyces sp. TLI_171]RKE22991.1 hypothetical protein BX266_6447 [Streptomyces sp. TLI_171]
MFIAADDGPNVFAVLVPALIVVVLIIGAFVWGSRRVARRRVPPPQPGPAKDRAESWSTPDEERPPERDRGAGG